VKESRPGNSVVGFDVAGNPLEVMYNQIDDETINVFHAMKCRKSFREQVGLEEMVWHT
jgi:hypothetical protein